MKNGWITNAGGFGWTHYVNGVIHCEDGPAIEYSDGDLQWVFNGKTHRIGGPAYIGKNGTQFWSVNGKYHREDGPATINHNGEKHWYLDDELIECKTQEEFDQLIRLKSFW